MAVTAQSAVEGVDDTIAHRRREGVSVAVVRVDLEVGDVASARLDLDLRLLAVMAALLARALRRLSARTQLPCDASARSADMSRDQDGGDRQ
jgi:hypothetical protein